MMLNDTELTESALFQHTSLQKRNPPVDGSEHSNPSDVSLRAFPAVKHPRQDLFENLCTWDMTIRVAKMLKEDTALELDVMNKIRFMILWKKDEILTQLVRHMKKRQRFLAQERGE